ncbi:hypothetical protein THRCLA_08208 [Thraustotheca clavata]|uniref:Uncharacterized protein n=1 Tax=Thraustotheca clavata TaxID=74557 RepID=A0A1V9Z8G9_9STRA|nr:hypothetical protein THRCLA_08208 [Thraustotheca clavata]
MNRFEWKAHGNSFVQAKEYAKAIEAYTNALDDDTVWDVPILCNRAFAWLQIETIEGWTNAIADCSSVLRVDPSNVKALYRRAMAQIQLNELENAKMDLEKIVTLEPGNPQALVQLEKVRVQLAASVSKHLFNPEFQAKVLNAVVRGEVTEVVTPMPPAAPPAPETKVKKSCKVEEAMANMIRECSLTTPHSTLDSPVSNSAWLELQAVEASIKVPKTTKMVKKRSKRNLHSSESSHKTDALWQTLVEDESRTRQQLKKLSKSVK